MIISANQLTSLRILLMPLPWFLIYGGTGQRTAAIIILFILGFTDYFDGLLARKYGTTALGRLLDPIADKIFVAVTLLPLLHQGILPMWVVWPIFLREFLVTELRRFLTPGRDELKVTELAKIKTTVQMTGIGLILITATFPDKSISFFLIYLAMAGTSAAVAWFRLSGRKVPSRLGIGLFFLLLGLLPLLFFPTGTCNTIYGAVLLAITLASGAQYVRATLPACLKRGYRAIAGLLLSEAMPLALLLALPGVSQTMAGVITLVITVEFCSQGMDMWASQQGHRTYVVIKESFFVPLTFSPLVYGWLQGAENMTAIFITAALTVSIIYAAVDIFFLRDLLFRKK